MYFGRKRAVVTKPDILRNVFEENLRARERGQRPKSACDERNGRACSNAHVLSVRGDGVRG